MVFLSAASPANPKYLARLSHGVEILIHRLTKVKSGLLESVRYSPKGPGPAGGFYVAML